MPKKFLPTVPRAIFAGIVGFAAAVVVRRRRQREQRGFVHRLLPH